MVRIVLEDVTKAFDGVVAVNGIDLHIEDGTFAVLLGPSGCGKTTTLNMIAGLEQVSSGRILFDDTEVQWVPPHRRDIAMVFQSYALYPNRSVRENIGFPLRMARVPAGTAAERVASVAAKVSITELLDRRPRQLSGGQQQRVALARAIVRRPRAFLLDEPLSNLDAKLRVDMRFELKALQRDLGVTFVHVTHDQAEAMSLADTLVVMDKGTVRQVGPPREVYRAPADLFAARFVGVPAMNLVAGQVTDGVFYTSGWSTPLGTADVRGDVVMGVRPEDLRLVAATSRPAGRVEAVEHLGSESFAAVRTAADSVLIRVDPDTDLAPGTGVVFDVNTARVHLFDPVSGLRVPAAGGREDPGPQPRPASDHAATRRAGGEVVR